MALLIKIKRPKKRKPGDRAGMTRTKIAAAAAEQIQKGGPDAFSFRKLAKSLGVAPTTVSSHFKGGLVDLEDEIIRTVFANVAPPFEPKQEPAAYLENLFSSVLATLRGRSSIASLAILRLAENPFVAPRLVERTLASLAAMGVAPRNMPVAFRTALHTLFSLILAGPAQSYPAPKGADGKQAHSLLALSEGEYPYVTRFRGALLDDLATAASWTPTTDAVKSAVRRLIEELGLR